MINIVLIAPPASGKGTQSELISSKYNLPHISTGNLIREIEDEDILNKINSGQLLSDELVLSLLEKKLKKCNNGFILDGFPRNIKQVEMYFSLMAKLNYPVGKFIYLDVSKEVAVKRITGRKFCPMCQTVYNDEFYVSDLCVKDHTLLERRLDDSYDVFNKRFEVYMDETLPVIDYLKDKNLIYFVDSQNDKEVVFSEIEKIIDEV